MTQYRGKFRHIHAMATKRSNKNCSVPKNVYQISATQYTQTFPQLMFIAATKPEMRGEIEEILTMTLNRHCEELEKRNRINHLFTCYEEALKFYPDSAEIHNNLGAHLFRFNFYKEAATYFRRAITLDAKFVAAKDNLEKVALAVVERWHFAMLNDTCRNGTFARAIRRAVIGGRDIVLDIGSGTAIFSMVAAKYGAKQVFACEASTTMADISLDILRANGFDPLENKVTVLSNMSTDLKVPEDIPGKVSLVVTETLDAGVFGERILTTLSHAWQHLLLPPGQGKVIPSSATLYMALVECTFIRNYSRIPRSSLGCLDIAGLQLSADFRNEPYTTERLESIPGGFRFLSSPCQLSQVDFNSPENINRYLSGDGQCSGSVTCEHEGTLDAMAVWFELQVDEENSFNTHPSSHTCWEQAIFPINLPSNTDMLLQKGSKVSYHYNCQDNLKLVCTDVTFPDDSSTASINNDSRLNYLHTNDIAVINQPEYIRLLVCGLEELREGSGLKCNKVFLDTHDFPIWGLMAVKLEAAQKCDVADKYQDVVERICVINSLKSSSFSFGNNGLSEVEDNATAHNCVFLDLLDRTNGTLKSGCLHKIPQLVSASDIVLPYKIHCVGYLAESEDLWSQSRVVSDENTLGFEIAAHMNCFKVRNHLGISLATLRHRKLSEPRHIFSLDLNQMPVWFDKSQSVALKTTTDGKVTALVYWFEIQLTKKDKWFSTFSTDSNFLHAAVILDEQILVAASTTVTIDSCVVDGDIHIDVIIKD